jgi:CRP-like cAMP-binding protein
MAINNLSEFDTIVNYIQKFIPLSLEEQNYFTSLLRITQVKKKQHIVQPDFVCRYRTYVYKGAMRAYLLDNNGHEHTIALAITDWWISDYNSYIFQQPATLFVEAMEPSVLIQLDYNAEQLLKETLPKFEKFFRIITERSFAFLQKRLLNNLSLTAEQRYIEFMNKYGAVAQKVPQYVLASYLGMSTEYYSKLRNNKALSKKLN